jgi:hypothetical protein
VSAHRRETVLRALLRGPAANLGRSDTASGLDVDPARELATSEPVG